MTSKFELKRFVRGLQKIRGRHTELVSVYIPAGYNLNEIVNFLTSERSEAENIKSKQTKKSVQSALERIQRRLKEVNKLPENGVAIFAGNASEVEGRVDIGLWEMVPPHPVKTRIYRCDKEFVLEPLKNMLVDEKLYAVISVDRSESAVATLRGKIVEIVKVIESNVPGKQKAGGQSQQRYARIRQGLYDTFMKETAATIQKEFLEVARSGELQGIIVGGPGHTKEELLETYFPEELKKNIIATENTNYAGEDGIHEVLQKADEIMEEADLTKEKKLLEAFFLNLKKGNGMSVYGLENTQKALGLGAVDKLLVSENLTGEEVIYGCDNCSNEIERKEVSLDPVICDQCQHEMILKEDEALIDDLEEKTNDMGTEFHLISAETQEGKQFKALGAVGGILRYRI